MSLYFLQAVDPIHPGAGGYSLGRVDNSVTRDPATGVPKIPGSGLHGAIRHYAADLFSFPPFMPMGNPVRFLTPRKACAGQGGRKNPHCGKCAICYTFGYTRSTDDNYAGTINIFDAQILLFPVRSIYGPVYITTENLLEESEVTFSKDGDLPAAITADWVGKPINIGWQVIQTLTQAEISVEDCENWKRIPKRVQSRTIIVPENDLGMLVNSNLEIRTSVAINPKTGTAEEKALFNYEAIPRSTIFAMEAIEDNYRTDQSNYFPARPNDIWTWNGPLEVFKAGLREIEKRGVGGMGTRGFGRLKWLEEVETDDQS